MSSTYKMMLIGESKVGKTTIQKQFCTAGQFPDGNVETKAIGVYSKEVPPCSRVVLCDTPAMIEEDRTAEMFVNKMDAFICVYDISNKTSFDQIKFHIAEVKKMLGGNFVKEPLFMLVGNKCNLKREVTKEEGQSFAYCFDMLFTEISAAHPNNQLQQVSEVNVGPSQENVTGIELETITVGESVDSMISTLTMAIKKKREDAAKREAEKNRMIDRGAYFGPIYAAIISVIAILLAPFISIWFAGRTQMIRNDTNLDLD